jgi:hypothetical protein
MWAWVLPNLYELNLILGPGGLTADLRELNDDAAVIQGQHLHHFSDPQS